MTLNGTLIVQAINFFIAYVLLRWLYFKPAIAQIQHEEEIKAHIKNTILEGCSVIEKKQQQQKEYWLECQDYCQERMPSIQKTGILISKETVPAIEPVYYDVIQLEQLADTLTDVLLQRIDHVS